MEWWLSSKRMTVWVETKHYIVIDSAPIVRKFQGQPIKNLVEWMSKQGSFKKQRIR